MTERISKKHWLSFDHIFYTIIQIAVVITECPEFALTEPFIYSTLSMLEVLRNLVSNSNKERHFKQIA